MKKAGWMIRSIRIGIGKAEERSVGVGVTEG